MPPEVLKVLHDMCQAAERIARFTLGRTIQDYRADEMLRSAVERQFEIIGEALTRLSKLDTAVASRISDHRRIISFRNVLIHGYDAIDDNITWSIVEQKLPILRAELDGLMAPPP